MSVPDKFCCLCVVVNSCGLWWHERLDDVSTTLSFLLASSVADRRSRRLEKCMIVVHYDELSFSILARRALYFSPYIVQSIPIKLLNTIEHLFLVHPRI